LFEKPISLPFLVRNLPRKLAPKTFSKKRKPKPTVISSFLAASERTYQTEVIAKALLLTPRRVRQLTVEGVLTRARDPATGEFLRGRYELFPTLHAYIRFLREGRLRIPTRATSYGLEQAE
jgi:hypothetical protein